MKTKLIDKNYPEEKKLSIIKTNSLTILQNLFNQKGN
jgi:hypothetical protein